MWRIIGMVCSVICFCGLAYGQTVFDHAFGRASIKKNGRIGDLVVLSVKGPQTWIPPVDHAFIAHRACVQGGAVVFEKPGAGSIAFPPNVDASSDSLQCINLAPGIFVVEPMLIRSNNSQVVNVIGILFPSP